MITKTDILRFFPNEIEELIKSEPYSQPKYRAAQIFSWLHRGADFSEMSNLPSELRRKLSENCIIKVPRVEEKYVSSADGTVKYLFELFDGEHIEAVYMKYEHGNTLCVSSQVGCRMGCRFCASTKSGRIRNLSASEILGEIIAAQNDTGTRISNVVMMGIGEPLDNFDETVRFLKLVSHPDGINIGLRHISVSTCGVVPKIYELAKLDLPITLSISLHAANDRDRSSIMPVNDAYSLNELMTACSDYFSSTGRRISFEYTLIMGKNDSLKNADELASLLKKYMKQNGRSQPVHVNLIPLNDVDGTGMSRPNKKSIEAFTERLKSVGINATVRRRLGPDIDAACGQLRIRSEAAKNKEQENSN